ncbi:MAG TPA: glucose-6-phosphate isomerase family protein, partial [Anaerolineales bacterium]
MTDAPFTFTIPMPEVIPSRADNHIQRRLADLKGQFLDQAAYQQLFAEGNRLIYEVYEIKRPQVAGELLMGISIVHPGKVGHEFFMTKGHFHSVIDT